MPGVIEFGTKPQLCGNYPTVSLKCYTYFLTSPKYVRVRQRVTLARLIVETNL